MIAGGQIGSGNSRFNTGIQLGGSTQGLINNSEIFVTNRGIYINITGPSLTVKNSTIDVAIAFPIAGIEIASGAAMTNIALLNSRINVAVQGYQVSGGANIPAIQTASSTSVVTLDSTIVNVQSNLYYTGGVTALKANAGAIQVNRGTLSASALGGGATPSIKSGSNITIDDSTCSINGSSVTC